MQWSSNVIDHLLCTLLSIEAATDLVKENLLLCCVITSVAEALPSKQWYAP